MQTTTGCSAGVTEPFALRVMGNSMLPEFKDGDIIIVDPGHPLCHGAFVVLEYQNEVIFGQYNVNDQSKHLCYLNDHGNDIELINDFNVKGVVTQRSNGRRKYLKHYS